MTVKDEFKTVWQETAVAYFKTLHAQQPGEQHDSVSSQHSWCPLESNSV
jgi:hypothetical protein